MKGSMVLMLAVLTLVVVGTEAGWFRNTFNSVKSGIKRVATKAKSTAKNVKEWAKKVSNGFKEGYKAGGSKRSANEAACEDLKKDSTVEFSRTVADTAFNQSDENGDGTLDEKDFAKYKYLIETYEQCMATKAA